MLQTKVVETIKNIFLFNNFFSENLAVHARWIAMATNTHLEYVIVSAFPRQRWLRERTLL
jgi:hypothetical protein